MNMETTKQYPVMPLKNTVLFPQQVIPIYVGREKSLKLIEDLPEKNKYLVVVAQQDGSIEDPKEDDRCNNEPVNTQYHAKHRLLETL